MLIDAFNPATVDGLMCRNTINVSWEGEAHDCDFNQMLRLPLAGNGRNYVWDLDPHTLAGRRDRDRQPLLRLHRRGGIELRRRADHAKSPSSFRPSTRRASCLQRSPPCVGRKHYWR